MRGCDAKYSSILVSLTMPASLKVDISMLLLWLEKLFLDDEEEEEEEEEDKEEEWEVTMLSSRSILT